RLERRERRDRRGRRGMEELERATVRSASEYAEERTSCLDVPPSTLSAVSVPLCVLCVERGRSYLRKWNGTLVTITFGLNRSAPLMRSARWLWSRWCHQRAGTNSGRTTVTKSYGRSLSTLSTYSRSGSISEREGEDRTTRGTPCPQRSHWARTSSVALGSVST